MILDRFALRRVVLLLIQECLEKYCDNFEQFTFSIQLCKMMFVYIYPDSMPQASLYSQNLEATCDKGGDFYLVLSDLVNILCKMRRDYPMSVSAIEVVIC